MSRSPGGRTSTATQQRIRVEWEELRLSHSEEGYGETALPLEDLIRNAVRSRKEILPAVVWIYDLEDEKTQSDLETRVFADEKVGIAMKRFVCLKGSIDSIPDAKTVRALRRKAPLFYFVDPGREICYELSGRRATSRSRFYGAIEKLWRKSFDTRLRVFSKQMSEVLDRIDEVEGEKAVLEAKRARAEGNRRKLAALARDEEKLREEEEKVLEMERDVLAACQVKDEFLPSEEAARK